MLARAAYQHLAQLLAEFRRTPLRLHWRQQVHYIITMEQAHVPSFLGSRETYFMAEELSFALYLEHMYTCVHRRVSFCTGDALISLMSLWMRLLSLPHLGHST